MNTISDKNQIGRVRSLTQSLVEARLGKTYLGGYLTIKDAVLDLMNTNADVILFDTPNCRPPLKTLGGRLDPPWRLNTDFLLEERILQIYFEGMNIRPRTGYGYHILIRT